ncbi:MAG: carbohydrate kinase family protein [candidate division SR1 bacterium CG_4_9_14_3_um_filter_40_9]|nr:MAG: carbohydrate kinase family protein [candidate division SR1 bacterium CG_4_9_14_3_um_filter_40_9]
MGKILVSGSIAYDYIMKFDGKFSEHILKDQLENLNVGFTISELQKSGGGTAHNIAYNLGLLGLKNDTIMLAAVGKDFIQDENLSKYVNYANVLKDPDLFTPCAYITTDSYHNQITNFYPGAMMKAVNQHVPKGDIQYAIIAPNAKDAMLMHLKECHSNDIKCFFDPGQAMTLFSKEDLMQALENSTYLICNEYEFGWILEKTGLQQHHIINMLEKIVITLGKNGASLLGKQGEVIISGVKVEDVIDPTGAGDSFRSGLLAGLAKGLDREDSAKMGNVVASFVVASQGTLHHHFTREDVLKKFQETYDQNVMF